MGSQSVTDFSAVKKKRIRKLLNSYSPQSSEATRQAMEIGSAAVGALGSAGNEFLQAMASPSVATAMNLLMTFANEFEKTKDFGQLYEKYGVRSEIQKPSGIVSAYLTRALSDSLSAAQEETDSAFAAKDALSKTIVDVISSAFPREKEPAEVNREKFAKAFKDVNRETIADFLLQNVANALISLVLDATRGSLRPGRVAELKTRIRRSFVPGFIQELVKGK